MTGGINMTTINNISRTDLTTGKKYFLNNIPVGFLTAVTLPNGTQLKIFPENGTTDCWYNGRFIGDRYAVFVKTGAMWQQISKWYNRYGYATRVMCRYKPLSKEEYTRNYCKQHGIRYQIKGIDKALYIWSPITRSYMQICFSLYNLTENQIRNTIENHIANYLK